MDPRVLAGASQPEATVDPSRPLDATALLSAPARLGALYAIGRQLLEQRRPEDVIATIRDVLAEHIGADHACVLAVDGGNSYRPIASHGLDLRGPVEGWPLSRTVLERVRESGLGILVSDVQQDAQLEAAGSIQKLRIRSVMCVPLGQRPVRGLVYVDSRGDRRTFTREDLEFLGAVSAYAALVLERAQDQLRADEALRLSDERREVLQGELLRHQIVGRSPSLLAAYDTVRRFARARARVHLRGETGTGKELFARAYAANSPRSGGPYVPVPIPALAPGLVESELFGHVRGAFTEATRDKKGRLELADGGLLFLDEVGDIEASLQPKLLRFLDSGELFRVGDTECRRVDALVVSATNRPLEKEAASGRYRGDLLARLGHVVTIPPLRERPEDVPLLVDHFLERHARGGDRKTFSAEAMALLQRHAWPFNVRELEQVVERAVCLVDAMVIRPEDLPEDVRQVRSDSTQPGDEATRSLREVVEEAERRHIAAVLQQTGGNRRRAIEILQVSPDTFYRRLDEFGLRKRDGERS